MAPKFLGHCRNDAPIPATLFFKTRRGQSRQVMRVGNYSQLFSSRELLLFLLVGPSSEYGTSEYSSIWVLWVLCAQFLKYKKQYFFFSLHCISKRNCFWIYNFLCNMPFGRKWTGWMDGWMDGWLPGYYYTYYRVTLYNRMHTNLQYTVLSCISL